MSRTDIEVLVARRAWNRPPPSPVNIEFHRGRPSAIAAGCPQAKKAATDVVPIVTIQPRLRWEYLLERARVHVQLIQSRTYYSSPIDNTLYSTDCHVDRAGQFGYIT
jgi:hypothetical protein